jgi:Ca-activated chloride channel family protein
LAKIPSKLTNKDKSVLPPDAPSFQVNASLVSVDVAVLDSEGHFIPNIPKSNFRILEDHVPQSIRTFSIGEAPVTVCMVIEFSNRFQQYRSSTRDQTL